MAQRALAHVEGRGVGDDEDRAAGGDQVLHGIAGVERALPELFVVPGVLADGDGEALVAGGEQVLVVGGDEVAVLVEDVVGGQQGLGLAEDDFAAAEDGGGVGGALAGGLVRASDVAGEDGDGEVGGFGGELLDGLLGAQEEAGLFDQVARRVAGDGEFRERR